jgi:preprotein translocase subunit Sec61beta
MVANNQNSDRSPLARLKARAAAAAAAGTVSYSQGKRTFRPAIRMAAAANDNKLPPSVIVYRTLAIGAIVALLAAAFVS